MISRAESLTMESSRRIRGIGPEEHGSFIWAPEGTPIAIYFSLEVVDRLLQDVMRGFGAVPRRGAEVGGILLGTVEPGPVPIVRIEEFEPVPCEYKRGPSYLLSEHDLEMFDEVLDRAKRAPDREIRVVGYYRSHTRDGEMALTPQDLELFSGRFPEPSDVVLLIKPYASRVSTAGFFIQENGSLAQGPTRLEFPFRRREMEALADPARSVPLDILERSNREKSIIRRQAHLEAPPARLSGNWTPPSSRPRSWIQPEVTLTAGQQSGVEDRPASESSRAGEQTGGEQEYQSDPNRAERAESRDESAGDSVPPPKLKLRKGWVWIPLSFIFLLVGVLLGIQAALTIKTPVSSSAAPDPYGLALTVSREEENLHLKWNRDAPPIRTAYRGTLAITDQGFNKTVELDPSDLQNGSVMYKNAGNLVQFRLEVFPKDRTSVTETLEWKK